MHVVIKKPNYHITFPQANDIYKLIKIVDNINGSHYQAKLESISLNISERQLRYYKDSARYLGLLDEKGEDLTDIGLLVFSRDFKTMLVLMVSIILSDEIFYDYYENKNYGLFFKQ